MTCRKQEAARYLVESEANPGESYMVDLLAWQANGECSCQHFQMRILPALRDGQPPLVSHCKHITRARAEFTNDALRRMFELMTQSPPDA